MWESAVGLSPHSTLSLWSHFIRAGRCGQQTKLLLSARLPWLISYLDLVYTPVGKGILWLHNAVLFAWEVTIPKLAQTFYWTTCWQSSLFNHTLWVGGVVALGKSYHLALDTVQLEKVVRGKGESALREDTEVKWCREIVTMSFVTISKITFLFMNAPAATTRSPWP